MTNEELADHIGSAAIAMMVKGKEVEIVDHAKGERVVVRLTRGLTKWKLERQTDDGWHNTGVLIDE